MSAEPDVSNDYDNSHRAFLQAFFSRPYLSYADAKPILAAILTTHRNQPTHAADIDEPLFRTYLHALNAAVSPLDYEIRHTIHQLDAQRTVVYALVNTTSDPQTQLATGLTVDEVAFVKRVIDAMFDDAHASARREVFAVKSTEAVNLAKVARRARDSGIGTVAVDGDTQTAQTQGGNASNITMARAEEVLALMCGDAWFEKSAAGYISLGVRGLMELRGWLRETYDDIDEGDQGRRIKDCGACKDIVTVGQRCSNYECDFRLHNVCLQRFFQSRNRRQCPRCRSEWTGKDYVGEKAARGYNERDRRSSTGRQSSTMAVRNNRPVEEDEESD